MELFLHRLTLSTVDIRKTHIDNMLILNILTHILFNFTVNSHGRVIINNATIQKSMAYF